MADGFTFQSVEEASDYVEKNPSRDAHVGSPAQQAPAASAKKSVWPWVVGVPVGLFLLMMVFGATVGNTPEAKERKRQRDVIKLCWQEYERKSLEPGTKRFVASTCESLEEKFRQQFRLNP